MLVSELASNKGQLVDLKKVAKKLAIPYRFLARLGAELKKGGLLESKEGRGGGYSLAAGWQKWSLGKFFDILGENKQIINCLCKKGNGCSQMGKCRQRGVWQYLDNKVRQELDRISLGKMLGFVSSKTNPNT